MRDGVSHCVGGGNGEIPAGAQNISRNGRPLAQWQGKIRAHKHIICPVGLAIDPVEHQVCAGQAGAGNAGLRRYDADVIETEIAIVKPKLKNRIGFCRRNYKLKVCPALAVWGRYIKKGVSVP